MIFDRGEVKDLLDQGLREGAFPGAVVAWGRSGSRPEIVARGFRGLTRNREEAGPGLVYDLASLTKVLASTSLAMIYAADGRLDLNLPLSDGPLAGLLPPAEFWRNICPADLLAHRSGLPPWLPFHRLGRNRADKRQAVLEAIVEAGPETPPGVRTIYSDLNFIILGFLLECLAGQGLDREFKQILAEPLDLKTLTYNPPPDLWLAPTEDGRRWGGPLGDQRGGLMGPVPLGRPHDDNAAFLDGVAGHAGLFGSAEDIWTLAAQWSLAARGKESVFKREILMDFTRPRPTREDAGRPLGFNLLGRVESLRPTARMSEDSLGHLGYTGPSLWWDVEVDFMWLFLTNRVHPRADNPAWKPGFYQGGPSRYLVFH